LFVRIGDSYLYDDAIQVCVGESVDVVVEYQNCSSGSCSPQPYSLRVLAEVGSSVTVENRGSAGDEAYAINVTGNDLGDAKILLEGAYGSQTLERSIIVHVVDC
jgi:hypothetical protein